MKFATKVIHAGIVPDPSTGAIMTPIYQTSTYVQAAPGEHKGYEYARTQNPTRTVLEENLAALENGSYGICFASGLAAQDAVMKLLNPGDQILSTNDLYGGSFRQMRRVYEKYGITSTFVDLSDEATAKSAIQPGVRLLWLETPTNPMLNIIDLELVCGLAKQHGGRLFTGLPCPSSRSAAELETGRPSARPRKLAKSTAAPADQADPGSVNHYSISVSAAPSTGSG